MYICVCKSLTDRDIRRGVFQGEIACMQSLRERLGASTGCGCCAAAARECLAEALAHKRLFDRECAREVVPEPGDEATVYSDPGAAMAELKRTA